MDAQLAKTKPDDIPPGICLLTPANLTDANLATMVTSALLKPASEVIIATAATQEKAPAGVLRDLRAVAKRLGKVFLVENDISLAGNLEAEGMLLDGPESIGGAREAVGERAMIGVVCGLSRHKAMEAGEAGADFVGFGEFGADRDSSVTLAEHIAWWSSIFEVPSVVFGVENMGEADAFLAAGADFLALGDPLWGQNDMIDILDALGAGAGPK